MVLWDACLRVISSTHVVSCTRVGNLYTRGNHVSPSRRQSLREREALVKDLSVSSGKHQSLFVHPSPA